MRIDSECLRSWGFESRNIGLQGSQNSKPLLQQMYENCQ